MIDSRFDKLEQKLISPDFRTSKGKANEVNYHIFDYNAKDELIIRDRIDDLLQKYKKGTYDFELKVFDLYDIIMEMLENKNFIDKCKNLEKSQGLDKITTGLNQMLRMSEDNSNNLILKHIKDNIDSNSIVIIKGVGKVFPFVRSHKILNNLHQCIDTVPVIMFYPGKFDEGYLSLFGEIKDDNYYRAFGFE
ncbi:hypothetical protein AN639_02625 [Candidatus Epulonipiscium fishelsonii]|uniref:Uncharacterized protein n=1 Tax=Candidatus Epulonipiscium fishelsonii TaxID=77094 RepID=A0ACC8X9Q2_9FIRM|nr:hypothetical protein AN396_09510 [Epulopiscium sp. SCG-B11WGA-EpuloA1]ONI42021.1 hypothetical protein AN639_02625 [Epulopiscium sp. SCG-B05WGA-EpuloA1]